MSTELANDRGRHAQLGIESLDPASRRLAELARHEGNNDQRRREIVLEVRETNVPAQLFFSNNGFRAVTVLRKHYDDTCEDAYYMRYCLNEDNTIPFLNHNRISEYDAA